MVEEDSIVAASRAAFEEKAFGEYFVKSIKKTNKSQFGFSVDCEGKATFCKRDEAGEYVREDVSAMWFGWKMHEDAEHKLKYPGLTEAGLAGFIVHSDRDFPLRPQRSNVPAVVQWDGGGSDWLKGATWAHDRWLYSLGVKKD